MHPELDGGGLRHGYGFMGTAFMSVLVGTVELKILFTFRLYLGIKIVPIG